MPSAPVCDFMALLLLDERARDRQPVPQHLHQFSSFPIPCSSSKLSYAFFVPWLNHTGVRIEIARNAQDHLTVGQTGQPLHLFSKSLLLYLCPTCLLSVDADDTYQLLSDHHPYGSDPALPSLHSNHFLADLLNHDDTNSITPPVSSCVQHLVSLRHIPCPASFPLRLLYTQYFHIPSLHHVHYFQCISLHCPHVETSHHPDFALGSLPAGRPTRSSYIYPRCRKVRRVGYPGRGIPISIQSCSRHTNLGHRSRCRAALFDIIVSFSQVFVSPDYRPTPVRVLTSESSFS